MATRLRKAAPVLQGKLLFAQGTIRNAHGRLRAPLPIREPNQLGAAQSGRQLTPAFDQSIANATKRRWFHDTHFGRDAALFQSVLEAFSGFPDQVETKNDRALLQQPVDELD